MLEVLTRVGCSGSVCGLPIEGSGAVELDADRLVTPASVMKVQVALTALTSFAAGRLDPAARIRLPAAPRTPGPVGISLLADDVELSARDLLPLMLTISDNVAADALIGLCGLDEVNRVTRRLGLTATMVTSDLRTMLDEMARDVGFTDWQALERRQPRAGGDRTPEQLRGELVHTAALDPTRGPRTTARETAQLLRLVWSDQAGPRAVCAELRRLLGQQLTRTRIASAFGPEVEVAAKSGSLMGVVRNEAGVVTFPDGSAYAVAVFTRHEPGTADGRAIDAAIGEVARQSVLALRPES